jgi:site-specific recombinase XerD
MTVLAPYLTKFLREHLPRERNASPNTISGYADTFMLLVRFAAARLKCRPSDLTVEDIGPDLVLAFLDDIEESRGNSARTRNTRLAAIRSFFRYLEFQTPECLEQTLRMRAVPTKRTDARLIDYLTKPEMQALLAAPDPRTSIGVRDRAMLHLTYAAGLRVAELLALRVDDFPDQSLALVRIMGKGRRERVLPLWRETKATLRAWLAIRPTAQTSHLFLNRDGEPMSRDGFAHRLGVHAASAALKQPSIAGKRVTPHVLRHSCAMHTLAATGDVRKVALWLGHASMQSTEAYLRADPEEKLAVLGAHAPPPLRAGKFKRPSDALLTMLGETRSIV